MSYSQALLGATASGPTVCIGLDPHPGIVANWGLGDDPAGLEEFVRISVGAVQEARAAAAKPQVALFERHGVAGMAALAALCGGLRASGVLVIGDAKRGDIGSTMTGYASAWLAPGGDFEVDALTVSPYLGVGALEPAFEMAREHHKGIFVLAATSNPEAGGLQSSVTPTGLTVAGQVVAEVTAWREEHLADQPAALGVVVGATLDQSALGLDLARTPDLPILAPGYGAQGASLSDVRSHFPHSRSVLAVAGRSLLSGPSAGFADRIRAALSEVGR